MRIVTNVHLFEPKYGGEVTDVGVFSVFLDVLIEPPVLALNWPSLLLMVFRYSIGENSGLGSILRSSP